MTPMHRLFSWFNAKYNNRRRWTSGVAPSIPSSAVTSSVVDSDSTTPKQVRFADDCGEALECVHVIPLKASKAKTFQENLEEAYIDETGVVTGFLSVTNLEPGRNILVRYTENEWKSYKQIQAHRFVKSDDNKFFRRLKNSKDSRSDTDDSWNTSSKGDREKFAFCFKVARRKSINVELAVISTLDGAVDKRHDQRYRLRKFSTSMVYCVNCWA